MSRAATRAVLITAVIAGAVGAAPGPPVLTYRFDEVKSKVLRAPGGDESKEVRVATGEEARGGDGVRTGFWARAVVAVPERKARFEIGSSTRVRLGSTEPGVLISLEKGRLEAFFEAIVGEPPVERRVAAPGALLAVRGTRYGLEVGSDGEALLAVFEGTVEVIPTAAGLPPVRVEAQHFCTFSPRSAPRPAPMAGTGMNERSWGRREAGQSREGAEPRQGKQPDGSSPAGTRPGAGPPGAPPAGSPPTSGGPPGPPRAE